VKKVVVKILQGSVVTQTTLGGLTIHPRVANFLQCKWAKNYENWMTVGKVIAKIIWLTFFWPTLYGNGKTANSSVSATPFKFEDVPARNAFEYLQMIYIARN